ncbi:MAG: nicotinamide mononucleotide transporter [Patescibacteria group bacterium]
MNKELFDVIAQVGVVLFGIPAIILVSRKNKWGFVLGLASQPFWLATSLINHQWGVVFLSVIYAASWVYGIYQWFFKKENN